MAEALGSFESTRHVANSGRDGGGCSCRLCKGGSPPDVSREISFFEWADPMQRTLIVLGVLLVAAGLGWPWLRKLPLGRLPGDIHIVREGFSFHFPIVTCIVISLLVTLLVWLLRR
jgi:hypothetical protein